MGMVAALAEQVRTQRTVAAPANPFVAMQEQFSRAMIHALDFYGDTRDRITEQMFHAIYGSPAVQAWYGILQNGGPPRQRPGQSPSTKAALDAEMRRLRGRVAEGNALDAEEALREQWAILAIDERAAIESLPQLVPPDAAERRALLDKIKSIVAAVGGVDADVQRRLREIEQLLVGEIATGKRTRTERTATADQPSEAIRPGS
jgi:hypothetical protein